MIGGWRSLLTVVAVLFLGMLAGYASLALGPVGWVVVFILTILVIAWLRRRPLRLGAYFVLLGATGAAILLPLVIGSQACPGGAFAAAVGSCDGSHVCAATCYAPSTVPALLGYLVVLLAGLIVATYAIARGPSRGVRPADLQDR
jgi:hypothetical protein